VAAAAVLADRVLGACPKVRIIAASREPLNITGEVLWPVRPLTLPPAGQAPDPAALAGYASVQLLAQRARAVCPGFEVEAANAADVARICRALDGMPLAIELAAARLRSMSPEQVAVRLDDRFRLLTGGSRTALPRHQTLRAVVDWSWELLDEAECVLWRRFSVFAGGATLEAVEQVCAGGPVAAGQVLGPRRPAGSPGSPSPTPAAALASTPCARTHRW
jgi:predicted ATPase